MEGASITIPAGTDSSVYQGLHWLSVEHGLLNPKVTNYPALEYLTLNLIRAAFDSSQPRVELVNDLLDLWFPALTASVDSWSHCWDLDLEVEGILMKAGYPDFNDDIPDACEDSNAPD